MSQIPIQKETIDRIAAANKIQNPGKASIREMRKMIQDVEKETGVRFVKMEMGIPGLPAPQVGVQAQIEALKSGVASIYPEIYGTADFKKEAARFVKNFLDIDVTPDCCVPTVGSMQAGFASFLTLTRYDAKKTKVLFIDPGFPVQKQQCRVLGIPMKAFWIAPKAWPLLPAAVRKRESPVKWSSERWIVRCTAQCERCAIASDARCTARATGSTSKFALGMIAPFTSAPSTK